MESDGALRGYAYGANIGWINFETNGNPRIDLLDGSFSGSAYGANVGWISLSNLYAVVQTDSLDPGPDTDADMIPDAWELWFATNLTVLSTSGDLDGDGVTDKDEYLAGTNPDDANSLLVVTGLALNPGAGQADVTWQSVETRRYELHLNPDLPNAAAWLDSGLGQQDPDPGAATTRTVPIGGPDAENFRVNAIRPLAP